MDPNSLLFFSVIAMTVASPTEQADQAIMTAYFKQSGIEQTLQDIEKRQVPKQVEIYVGKAIVLTQIIFERRISVKWTF